METAALTVNPHVLVVDDDRDIRELLAKYLERQNFRVTAVRDAREARRIWPTMSFQLVILDLMLPGEGGLDFARWLRAVSITMGRLRVRALARQRRARATPLSPGSIQSSTTRSGSAVRTTRSASALLPTHCVS